jgi:DUF1680 family protein
MTLRTVIADTDGSCLMTIGILARTFLFSSLAATALSQAPAAEPPLVKRDLWSPLPSKQVGGILGERLRLWRANRLWRVVNDPFLLRGFEAPPGTHPWQGEHAGKWLHAATLAHQTAPDPRLLRMLQETVRRLIATQQDNGYIGTYPPDRRFFAPPGQHTRASWDVWTARYVIYGLLAYEKFHPDPSVVAACVRLGDLLLDTYGPGKADLTSVGTRQGMSSTVLLESVVNLYQRTGEKRFLDFAEHIHRSIERNEDLRLVTALLSGQDVSIPGDGKAYQMMSTLLGYGGLFRYTGEMSRLSALTKAWEDIRKEHTYETGGPWSYKSDRVKNHECFADPSFFHPTNLVETCSTTTWVQLSLELLQLTGQSVYGSEAERAMLNALIGAQSPNGRDWAYFTASNVVKRDYNDVIHCCGSSGPRALEVYARYLVGVNGNVLSINSYLPLSASLSRLPASAVTIEGNYPFDDHAFMRLDIPAPAQFSVDFRVPAGADGLEIKIEGIAHAAARTASGFYRITRTWAPGERIRIGFQFPVRAHLQRARDGRMWVAFTRGPLALAQGSATRTDDTEIARPKGASLDDGSLWLQSIEAGKAGVPQFQIKGTGIVLLPYFQAGGDGSSVRTYFPLKSGAATTHSE